MKNGFAVEQTLQEKKEGKLKGLNISVKDCICVKGMESSASSKILKGHKPLFHATAIQKVLDEGAIIIGKTKQDEFGFGTFCTNVEEPPTNPHDKTRVCGGSSGGSGALTKQLGKGHVSLAESTGGSIAAPAAYCGVIGLTPTYGRVSRSGLIDYANSLDKIGPMATTIKEIAQVLQIIAGRDEADATSLDAPVPNYEAALGKPIKGMKMGIIKESLQVDAEVKEAFEKTCKQLEAQGAILEEVSLKTTFAYGVPTYYVLALSEASTNLSKYCGMRYGATEKIEGDFNEYFSKVRGKYFGKETKRRILLGTFARMSGYRDAYYMKAAKIRTKIINEYKEHFKTYDVLISPTMPNVAPKFEEVEKLNALQSYMMDILTVGPSLAGVPHISVPVGEGLPKGFMIIADHLQEEKVLQVAYAIHN